jgi:hypothetical protein
VNDVPHIGHAYTTVTADALARWHRLVGDDVFFLTGTDEHGLKISRAAEANGITPQAHADEVAARYQRGVGPARHLARRFIRTTDADHQVAVQAFLQKAYDNGHIYKAAYEGWYCVACEAYYDEGELLPNPDGGAGSTPSTSGRSSGSRRRTGSSGCRRSNSRCSTGTRPTPTPCSPTGKRNEALGLIRTACGTSRSAAPRSTGACRCRGTRATSSTSGTTR